MGEKSGLDFNNPDSVIVLHDDNMIAQSGCTSMCDSSGKLLFYSNGVLVYNKNHKLMPNGVTLAGSSESFGVLAVKKPGSTGKYMLLTTDNDGGKNGLTAYEIDMSLDYGRGDVIKESKKKLLSFCCEMLEPIQHSNGRDIWIVTHTGKDTFLSYLLTENGLSEQPVISKIGDSIFNSLRGAEGSIAYNPVTGKLAAHILSTNRLPLAFMLMNFNNSTGVISGLQIIRMDNQTFSNNGLHGLEFSPNGKFVYVAEEPHPGTVYQFDVSRWPEKEIQSSRVEVGRGYGGISGGDLRLAPNGKIYFSRYRHRYLASIEHPNQPGTECGYNDTAIFMGVNNWSGLKLGLPNQLLPYPLDLEVNSTCLKDTARIVVQGPDYDFMINYGDGNTDTLSANSGNLVYHKYSSAGDYTITLTYPKTAGQTFSKNIKITAPPRPLRFDDTIVCPETELYLIPEENAEVFITRNSELINFPVQCSDTAVEIIHKNTCGETHSTQFIGCKNCDCKLYIMNAVSNNYDGRNDLIRLTTQYCEFDKFSFRLYNRLGNIIFESDDVHFEVPDNLIPVFGDYLMYNMEWVIQGEQNQKSGIIYILH